MKITKDQVIDLLVDQVEGHHFRHLYKNRPTGDSAKGWAGGLAMYSANEGAPNPSGHFKWLNKTLDGIKAAKGMAEKIKLANRVLKWGGMRTTIANSNQGSALLSSVLDSAALGIRTNNAPMNSSYTKIAAVFEYHNQKNTIWDSRVSTALCFRLACILEQRGCDDKDAQRLFPGLGFISGVSQRVKGRQSLVKHYWPNVYQKWDGHFTGAYVINLVAQRLNERQIECPQYEDPFELGLGQWTPWKVNMVFFIDDITKCPVAGSDDNTAPDAPLTLPAGGSDNPPPPQKAVPAAGGGSNPSDRYCDHQIVNHSYGIHFEPNCIKDMNAHTGSGLSLPKGKHGLDKYRLLLEFYRFPGNGNCKIGARMRTIDPAFDKVIEAAEETGCPNKRGGVDLTDQTSSIFVFPRGKVKVGQEKNDIRNFTCNPSKEYAEFLKLLPAAMSPPY